MKVSCKTIKIVSLATISLLAALTFALIPINIFCANFPEWVTVLLSVLFCGGLVAYLIIFKTKLVTKIILPIVFGLVAVICSFLPFMVPYWNSYAFKSYNGVMLNYDDVISYKAAEEDFKALKAHLERTHPMFKSGLTEEIENAYNAALERLQGREKITVNDLRREIQSRKHTPQKILWVGTNLPKSATNITRRKMRKISYITISTNKRALQCLLLRSAITTGLISIA